MSAFNFIATCGNNWHIETDGSDYRGHNQKENTLTEPYSDVQKLISCIKELEGKSPGGKNV